MLCPYCRTQNLDHAAFCMSCGARINAQQPAAQPAVQQQAFVQPVYVLQPIAYPQPVPQTPTPGKGLGVAGMVLGIIGLVVQFILLFLPGSGLIFAIPSFFLSGIGQCLSGAAKKSNGPAVAGLVCSILTIVICVTIWILIGMNID